MKIFKYYPPTKFSFNALEEGYFWFNFPENYNDPFDTNLSFQMSGSKKEWYNFLKISMKYSDSKIDKLFSSNAIIENVPYNIPIFQDNYRESRVVSCFSKKNNSILMWSHYANKHTGFCLGFKTIRPNKYHLVNIIDDESIDNIEFRNKKYIPLLKVEYLPRKTRPFNPLNDSDDILLKNILQKADVWSYENEFRLVIKPKHYKENIVKYSKEILSDVYIGYNTSDSTIKEIISILKFSYKKYIKIHYPDKSINDYLIKYKDFI